MTPMIGSQAARHRMESGTEFESGERLAENQRMAQIPKWGKWPTNDENFEK